jgi:membrane-bound lytic murein transglycosylase B
MMTSLKAITIGLIGVALVWQSPYAASAGYTLYSDRKEVRVYVDELVRKHKFNRAELLGLFRQAVPQQQVLDAIAKPAERELTWKEYRPIFLTEPRIAAGVEFWGEFAEPLARAGDMYGVSPEIIVAIIGVETRFGQYTGKHPVLDSLITLSFDGERRQAFFKSELEEFLLLVRDEQADPFSIKGSYAGAMGWPQFISSSYRHYAVDFDGDGRRDLWNNPVDAIGSVAHYFKAHGWRSGEDVIVPARLDGQARGLSDLAVERGRKGLKPVMSLETFAEKGVYSANEVAADQKAVLIKLQGDNGDEYWLGLQNFYVITRYNQSAMYALAVYQLSQEIRREYHSQVMANKK